MAERIDKQLTIRLKPDIHKALKVYCAENERSINDVINMLVAEFLQKQDAGNVNLDADDDGQSVESYVTDLSRHHDN